MTFFVPIFCIFFNIFFVCFLEFEDGNTFNDTFRTKRSRKNSDLPILKWIVKIADDEYNPNINPLMSSSTPRINELAMIVKLQEIIVKCQEMRVKIGMEDDVQRELDQIRTCVALCQSLIDTVMKSEITEEDVKENEMDVEMENKPDPALTANDECAHVIADIIDKVVENTVKTIDNKIAEDMDIEISDKKSNSPPMESFSDIVEYVKETDIIHVKDECQLYLSNTNMQYIIHCIHWRWHATRFIDGVSNAIKKGTESSSAMVDDHWNLDSLIYEGHRLGFDQNDGNADCVLRSEQTHLQPIADEWQKITAIDSNVNRFKDGCVQLLSLHSIDYQLLNDICDNTIDLQPIIVYVMNNSTSEKLKSPEMQQSLKMDKYINVCMNQMTTFNDRLNIILRCLKCSQFNDESSLITFPTLTAIVEELNQVSHYVKNIPDIVDCQQRYKKSIQKMKELELLFDSRSQESTNLLQTINGLFIQFDIMFRNDSVIDMNKYTPIDSDEKTNKSDNTSMGMYDIFMFSFFYYLCMTFFLRR